MAWDSTRLRIGAKRCRRLPVNVVSRRPETRPRCSILQVSKLKMRRSQQIGMGFGGWRVNLCRIVGFCVGFRRSSFSQVVVATPLTNSDSDSPRGYLANPQGLATIRRKRPQAFTEQGLAAVLRIVARNGGNWLRLILRCLGKRKCAGFCAALRYPYPPLLFRPPVDSPLRSPADSGRGPPLGCCQSTGKQRARGIRPSVPFPDSPEDSGIAWATVPPPPA